MYVFLLKFPEQAEGPSAFSPSDAILPFFRKKDNRFFCESHGESVEVFCFFLCKTDTPCPPFIGAQGVKRHTRSIQQSVA